MHCFVYLEPQVEVIDDKAGQVIKEFNDLVFPDNYNAAGKPPAKRKVLFYHL